MSRDNHQLFHITGKGEGEGGMGTQDGRRESRKGREIEGRRVRGRGGREGEHNTWSVSHPPNLENGRRLGLLGVEERV